MKKRILIIGGSSGIGLELARHYVSDGHTVCITGRHRPDLPDVQYQHWSISDDVACMTRDMDELIGDFPRVNTLIYAAGFCQRGHIDALDDVQLQTMSNVGLLAPMMLVQRLKHSLDTPLKVMLITSTSQFTARELEPAYCATKAGLGMLGACLVKDMAIGKVLVAAPAGTHTSFWRSSDQDCTDMLDASWVSEQIVELSSGAFKYKYAHILRQPARVEVIEQLDQDLKPV